MATLHEAAVTSSPLQFPFNFLLNNEIMMTLIKQVIQLKLNQVIIENPQKSLKIPFQDRLKESCSILEDSGGSEW